MIKHLSGNEKENLKSAKNIETDIQTSLKSKALEHISNNLILVVNITNLHSYYNWVSLYPNLEKLCSTRFINESTKPKEILDRREQSDTISNEKILDSCNFSERFIKDYVFTKLTKTSDDEEIRIETNNECDEKVVFRFKDLEPHASKPLKRSGGTLVSKVMIGDNAQIFKDPACLNDYPVLNNVTEEFFSESRFKLFLDTFNTLSEKIKSNLLRNKTFNQRYKERCQKIIEVYQKKGLVKESYNCSSNVRQQLANAASLNERIEELHAKIKEKEALIKLKEKISKDATENKSMLKNEIHMSVEDRMERLSRILISLEKCSTRDINAIPTTFDRLAEHERQLLEVLLHIIFLKDVPDTKFSAFVTKTLNLILDKAQLISILRARRDTNFNENTIRKIKNFTQKWTDDKFDKSVFKHIAKFFHGLVKKFNLKVMLESRYEKLEEVNQVLIQADLDIAYYKNVIEDLKEELEDLLIKQKNSSDDLKRKSRSITEDEARNEQIYKEVMKNLKKAEGKLFKSKVRMKNLFGDCLMLAASISYLGLLSQDDRTLLRKTMAEELANEKSIEVSEYWHSENENDNAKIFKKLICDFGYSEIFHSLSHLYND